MSQEYFLVPDQSHLEENKADMDSSLNLSKKNQPVFQKIGSIFKRNDSGNATERSIKKPKTSF